MMKRINTYIALFFTMMKIGLFTFGGGYAMIPLLEHEFVEKKRWLEKDEFYDILTVSETTPGPIAINNSTYIGYKIGGVIGSIVATVGVVIPSFVIIFVISLFFDAFLEIELVFAAFRGIRVAVAYLILSAGIKMIIKLKKSVFNIIVFSAVFILMILFTLFSVDFSSIFYILISAALGALIYSVAYLKRRAGKEDDLK